MLIDGPRLKSHAGWIAAVSLATLGAALWYAVGSFAAHRLLPGSSLPGIVFGVVGGAICLFEFLLWPRKKLRWLRVVRVQAWMKAHIWLGLLSLPILILHSGFRLGGPLSTVLMILFVGVIASGVWGLALQNILPKKMLMDVQAETIHSQIPRIIGQYRDEAMRLVIATCGRASAVATMPTEPDGEPEDAEESTHHLVVGAVRSAGRVSGKVLQTRVINQAVSGSEALRAFFETVAGPFLTPDGFARSPLRRRDRAESLFADLRTRLDPKAHPAVDAIENLCDQRRQLAEQDRLHTLLHNWLLVHLPLSVALIVLMFVHAFAALKYL